MKSYSWISINAKGIFVITKGNTCKVSNYCESGFVLIKITAKVDMYLYVYKTFHAKA